MAFYKRISLVCVLLEYVMIDINFAGTFNKYEALWNDVCTANYTVSSPWLCIAMAFHKVASWTLKLPCKSLHTYSEYTSYCYCYCLFSILINLS